jgi:ethanolamine ammonia-lyase small subunit
MIPFDPWHSLRKFTSARIGLGRAGGSLPTRELLDFALAHAEARDAVHSELDVPQLREQLESLGVRCVDLASRARSRFDYLQRPDLGRLLSDESRARLAAIRPDDVDLAIIAADGLSATATQSQTPPLLALWLPMLRAADIRVGPVALVRQGRVAIEDEIGAALNAKAAVILIGERPGLGAPVRLGAYLVFNRRQGNKDNNRNCVSNIRPAGLPLEIAASTLKYLVTESLRRRISGVDLKDERTETPALTEVS